MHRDPPPGATAAQQAFAQAVQMQQMGRLAEAEQLFRRVLAFAPRHADSLHLLGVVHLQAGRNREAADWIGKAVAVDARSPQFHNNLGFAQRGLGRLRDAEASFRRAVALRPDYPRALVNLAQVLAATDRAGEAVPYLRKAVAAAPGDLDAWWNLGLLSHQSGALDEAETAYRRALQLAPQAADIHNNLAGVLLAKGRTADGVAALRRALEIDPAPAERWGALANALEGEGRLTEAADAYGQAVRREPGLAIAHNGLGNVLANLGRLEEAVAAYREAVRLSPDHLAARSNLIMTLHSLAEVSAADILVEAKGYASRVEPRPAPSFANSRDPERRLRIGYVSADFRVHPVGFFLDRVLSAHEPRQVQAVLYSDVRFPDAQTERLRAAAASWRPIAGATDDEVLQMIRADGVDILVDLAGHTGFNRLAVFGARAAPVQVSWLGYFGTTGLASMDYVIGDEIVLPPGDEPLFSERPVRLTPPYLCWSPPEAEAPVGPFPALAQGSVTFGCFNNRAKINRQTVEAWARILARVEGSRLFLKSWSLADAGCRAGLTEAFAAHGIVADRLMFEGLTPRAEALTAYNRVDIALDPFPFGGCTTTADTLWMGVPLVTLEGERWSGRMSHSILAGIGLEAWATKDVDAYVETAVRLATELPGLAELRGGLRARVEGSAFCDGPGFARRLEAAYRDMWRTWCAARA
jgi:predicted O-linked N-acetylglucosamine transferase (SPINDLY family)